MIKISPQITKYWISNYNFKQKHIKNINNILKKVYEPIGHWGKIELYGVINLPWEKEKWSILNKINTNYSVLSLLINNINRAIIDGNSKVELFFQNVDFGSHTKFYEEYNRFINFIDKNRLKVFLKLDENTGSIVINEIVDKIRQTSKSGDNAEKLVLENMNKIFPNSIDSKMPIGYGEKNDMIGGIDISFKINEENKSIQVKKCTSVIKKDNIIFINGTSLASHYNTDYLSCVTFEKIYTFKYDRENIKILKNGNLMISSSLLINETKI